MKIDFISKMIILSKAIAIIKQAFDIFLGWYHRQKIEFVLGLTKERFSHAEFYIDNRKHHFIAKDFHEMETILRLQLTRFSAKQISTFELAQMWASRNLIRIDTGSNKIEIVTFWYF